MLIPANRGMTFMDPTRLFGVVCFACLVFVVWFCYFMFAC